MQKTINFLKSWGQRIATHPTVIKAFHTFWQSFLAVLLAGIFSTHSISELFVLVSAALAAGLSALKSYAVSLREQVTIPGEEN
jgi:hypothetical protein